MTMNPKTQHCCGFRLYHGLSSLDSLLLNHLYQMQNFYSFLHLFFFFADFSISEIAKDFELDLAGGLKEGAVHFILERLGLEEFFSGAKCDKRRKPFSPSVQGWNNGKMFIML